MSCTCTSSARSLQGIGAQCAPSRPGVETIYLFDHGAFTVTAVTEGDSAMTITAISAVTGTSKMYEYCLPKNTASLESPLTISDEGFVTYQNTISMQFNRLCARKHAEIQAMALGMIDAIVKDKNGKYWYVGYDEYLSPTEGNAGTGDGSGRNGYSIALMAESNYLPFEIPAAVFATLEDYIETPATDQC